MLITQDVTSTWYLSSWADYLVTNYGVVYAYIDGRGTGQHSNEMLFEVYKRLGTVEISDQIEVAQALLSDFSFLDPDRAGIWGWSYGGYATLRALQMDEEEVFKCGIVVAPPTNWLFYDTMYTERYMGLPTADDNQAGYDAGSVLEEDEVEKLRGRTFMVRQTNQFGKKKWQNERNSRYKS